MTDRHKGIALAIVHVLLILSLGGKLLIDRQTRPRVWAKVVPYDPETPIRGRYVSLNLQFRVAGQLRSGWEHVRFSNDNGQLLATVTSETEDTGITLAYRTKGQAPRLSEPLAYFIPEHVADPSRRAPGEELWVEVTIPKKGPPRPIQLGVKKNGVITPLKLD